MQHDRVPTAQALSNFRDLSTARSPLGPGFQFEFRCDCCTRPWRSAFTSYRAPVIDVLIGRATSWVSRRVRSGGATEGGLFDDRRARAAREAALADATRQAAQLYTPCPECRHVVCADCWNARAQRCADCIDAAAAKYAGTMGSTRNQTPALSCPSCHAPSAGGRFCAACGFDLAVTHKTCPACGAMTAREAHFCTRCGHGF
jgi:hypothetical protein